MYSTIKLFLLTTATVAICACGGPKTSNEETSADAIETAPPEVRVNNNGIFIDHKSCGEGDTTLLFVHGWAIDQTYWSDQVEAFCPDYQIVTIDLPGHGNSGSDRDSWTVEDYAGDVKAVIDQLHLNNVILIGHSMAGDIILEAATNNNKVIALVGVDNFKDVGAEYTEEIQAQISAFIDQLKTNFDTVATAYSKTYLFHPTTDSAVVDRVITNVVETDSSIATTTLQKLFEYAPKEADRLSQVNKKLYLINSSATPTDSAGLKATGVTYKILDMGATGHYPMIEASEKFNTLLRSALEDIKADANE